MPCSRKVPSASSSSELFKRVLPRKPSEKTLRRIRRAKCAGPQQGQSPRCALGFACGSAAPGRTHRRSWNQSATKKADDIWASAHVACRSRRATRTERPRCPASSGGMRRERREGASRTDSLRQFRNFRSAWASILPRINLPFARHHDSERSQRMQDTDCRGVLCDDLGKAAIRHRALVQVRTDQVHASGL